TNFSKPGYFFYQEKFKINGVITDDNDLPLPGVNITVAGTSKGTTTDFDGKYEIEVEAGQELVFSSIGFEEQKLTVNNGDDINIRLEPAVGQLNEVVVTALGIKREEKALGYAVQKVSGED